MQKDNSVDMKRASGHKSQSLWAKVVMRKWLNMNTRDSDYYSADTEDEDDNGGDDSDSCSEEEFSSSRVGSNAQDAAAEMASNDGFPRRRRRNSETFRAQYINTKEIRVCVGTWNVGGVSPQPDIDIDDWIQINDPADIYVLGLQEIVPLNAGNVLGAEDRRPVSKWENIIRDALNRVRPKASRVKSYSDPPSPRKFIPSEDVSFDSDSETGAEIHPIDEEDEDEDEEPTNCLKHDGAVIGEVTTLVSETCAASPVVDVQRQFSSPKKLGRQSCLHLENHEENVDVPTLTRILSGTERIGLSWPEPPLNMLGRCVLDKPPSFKSAKSFRATKSFKTYGSFKSIAGNEISPDVLALAEMDLETLMKRKRRPAYVRLVSKQMVGLFLTIWVKRSLRKHIQNVRVSTVGVGVMGYIGNKGAVSMSMSIYQTFFCFICTHLTAGERDVDQLKRNADVHEIHKRTIFHSVSALGLPKLIYDHERIIWLGDLNYRISMSYDKTRELISKKEWSVLLEKDQLVREYKKGRAFEGWSEGSIDFAPTYKYQVNSDRYSGEDARAGRRTPAWCDRVLSYGKGMRLVRYQRSEQSLSDHRPVTATYLAEVEVFSARKLQRALTFTDAEIEEEELLAVV
ncbi:PREDICTED: type IV inositol polyphosphate 5-phosphatase 3 [Tarenaya hassleriana]|uniref:type IV inositol polyphosphate 5-phosphatase 3 n=1 Tax=Tarenaya hassleriana TaxID=28532 RepID=UPI00053C3E3C|nr:PREDICTED: type IV inositol polyphosphate 5-phosphatase 3 [Tarenaya hassleriana]